MYTKEDLLKAKELIDGAENIAIFIHEDPDLDAIGSSVALKIILEKSSKKVDIFCPSIVPIQFNWINKAESIQQIDAFKLSNYNAVILCDSNESRRFGLTLDEIKSWGVPVLRIDHHPDLENFPGLQITDYQTSSTCELVYELAKVAEWEILPNVVESLFAGIMADTGWLHYTGAEGSNLIPTLQVVTELLQIHNCVDKVSLQMTLVSNFEDIDVWKVVLNKIQFDKERRILYYFIDNNTIQNLGTVRFKNAQTVIKDHLINTIKDVDVMISLKEREEGFIYGSCRSSFEKYHLGKICAQFESGGGHLQAAGFRTQKNLEEILEVIYEGMEKYRL